MLYIALLISLLLTILLTPLVIKLAVKTGIVDQPNNRKVHKKLMPRLGGLAIFGSFAITYLLFIDRTIEIWPIFAGGLIITAVGIVDDVKQISPKAKLLGQLLAALVTVLGGIQIDFVTLPFIDRVEFGFWAIPITIVWIIGVTNAINLIDGLDGLAAGVSSIAVFTISVFAVAMGNYLIALIGFILLGSTVGFLLFNFHPAKIFMGDTGSLFLGYMISVLAVSGLFKNVAMFSLLVPIIILAVPIIDTSFAIIRRVVNNKPLSSPDKLHLHHCLLRLGFSHRQTVLLIYLMSSMFSVAAVIFTEATIWGATLLIIGLSIIVELIVEITGLISKDYRPILNYLDTKKQN
ncbi:MraY family glycosyltransferase [Gracilibacillus salinarum]|uniref:Undecaprenyl/decaprenyl-phosphate alpha-N-acetylglucosaminyl 1-phosphate transferase n=1 Tax=Gracilibacillus salinarum TaxID=2932255 RepID=A0ABY4GRR0_9BACI|nr:MraY family glycosyltransferase [Gracilibacillus salinarum]UOQ87055.1 undecaprenyl/decaprenyl-phosphate alpha-N-acetylglucosaminyl 1-phosphate transferase [Gracilibacillus salinarum]